MIVAVAVTVGVSDGVGESVVVGEAVTVLVCEGVGVDEAVRV